MTSSQGLNDLRCNGETDIFVKMARPSNICLIFADIRVLNVFLQISADIRYPFKWYIHAQTFACCVIYIYSFRLQAHINRISCGYYQLIVFASGIA